MMLSCAPAAISCAAPPLIFTERSCAARRPRAIPCQKYLYPKPIPGFAVAETHKFKAELLKNLSTENDAYGNDLQRVVNICAEADILGVLAGGIGRAGNVINGAVHRYVCGPQRE